MSQLTSSEHSTSGACPLCGRPIAGSNVDDGAAAIAVRRARPWLASVHADLCVAGPGEGIEHDRDDADHKGAEKGGPKAFDVEGLDEEPDKSEECRVDDEYKQTECEQKQRQ